jgi:cytidine deaminase
MSGIKDQPSALDYPELVIGIAAPIGVDMELIAASLSSALKAVGYESALIKLTSEMERYQLEQSARELIDKEHSGADTFNTYMRKMSEANALRHQYDDAAVLTRIGIDAIRHKRALKSGNEDIAVPRRAYLVRQLKRPEEVDLLRKVYGRQFILVSAYAPENRRRDQLVRKLAKELSTTLTAADISYRADKLIERDASEDEDTLGQQLRDTFHRADVFIDGLDKIEMDATNTRFVNALFGQNEISPSKREYGMYAAKSASLRSADLSRQVGAAIFTEDGELITQGCNEVPKAGGGSYWDTEKPDHRDVKKGHDPNDHHKKEILRDLIERLRKRDLLSEEAIQFGTDAQIVDDLIAKKNSKNQVGALVGSRIMDVTEYGRVVHAEMLAITDAARLGRSVKGATLYCTTFPCHNCTKHLLAAGITRVVFMEPYPKSRAKDLHPDEVELESELDGKVGFLPFLGISPYRYRDLFQKGKRKSSDGKAQNWYNDECRPMIDVVSPSFTETEKWGLSVLLGAVKKPSN